MPRVARSARWVLYASLALGPYVLAVAACADNPYVIGSYLDAGDARCPEGHRGALLCSGFESAELQSEWSDVVIENAGEIERSTRRVHSGRGALRAATRAKNSAAVVVASFPPLESGELSLRAYLYVTSGLPTEIMNVFFVGAEPDPDPFSGVDINLDDGAVQVFSPQAEPRRQTGERRIPRDRWFCFRASLRIRDQGGIARAYVDDALALEATNIDSLPPGGVRMLRAGVDWSSEQDEYFEIYIDDVVVDTRPVACAE